MATSVFAKALSQGINLIQPSDWEGMDKVYGGTQVGALAKALEAGTGVDAASFTGGRSLQYESLESTLISTTLAMEDAVLWRRMPKRPIHQTIDQYTRRTGFGGEWGLAASESDNPDEHLADYARAFADVKFYRDKRSVSHVAMQTNMVGGDPAALEEEAGLLNIIQRLNFDMYWAQTSVFPKRVEGLWSALTATGANSTVYDMAGKKLTSRDPFNEAFARIRNKGGRVTNIFANPLIGEDLSKAYSSAERINISSGGNGELTVGAGITHLQSEFGKVAIDLDPFCKVGWAAPAAAAGDSTKRPGAPSAVAGAGGGTDGSIPAGTYYYKVSAVNESGESAVTTSAAVTVTAGQHVTLTITNLGSGVDPTGYRIYRSAKDATSASDCRYLTACAYTSGASTTFTDTGAWVPGTCHIGLLDLRPAAMACQWSQLFPASRLNLAMTSPVIPFLVNLYGAMRWAKPEWLGVIKNVLPAGDADAGWDPLGLYA